MQTRITVLASTLCFSMLLGVGLSGCLAQEDPFAVDEPDDCESVASQNQFVVDIMDEFYLWNESVPTDVDLSAYDSPEALAKALRDENDRWTRVADKATSDALFMEGKFIGLGYKTVRMEDDSVRISFVSDNSPASVAGILRGDEIVGVGGYTVEELDADNLWNQVYGADEPGVSVDVDIEHLATGVVETVTLSKDWIDVVSLPVVEVYDSAAGPTGYFVMDKFVETTKAELEAAFATFKEAGAETVIIDLRYNGGGLISVAERTVDLAVGADHDGKVAYSFQYNSNLAAENYSAYVSHLDNSIGADKIIVLVSGRTLSASELVINALFPYAEVTLVGSSTGGKPVGSKGFDFCDKRLYPVTFRLVNAAGNTDYFDGLPADCLAEDDVFHQFGDPQEGMLAAALAYLDGGACMLPAPDAHGFDINSHQAVGRRVLPNAELRDEIDSW